MLSSRLDPPLSLPRLRLAGRLRELRAAQMRVHPGGGGHAAGAVGPSSSPRGRSRCCTGGPAAGPPVCGWPRWRWRETADREAFLTHFSGDDRSVADYLVGEILSGLPEDLQEFLRVISICDLVPCGLAAELSGREDAASVLDRLEQQTSLVAATGPRREVYRVQELLRTYLLADLQRQGPQRVAELHAAAARWWADQERPVRALEHAAASRRHRRCCPTCCTGSPSR